MRRRSRDAKTIHYHAVHVESWVQHLDNYIEDGDLSRALDVAEKLVEDLEDTLEFSDEMDRDAIVTIREMLKTAEYAEGAVRKSIAVLHRARGYSKALRNMRHDFAESTRHSKGGLRGVR